MKKLVLIVMLAVGSLSATYAQVFEESMGTVTKNVSIAGHYAAKGFKNCEFLKFSGSAEVQLQGASPRNSIYATLFGEASRGANIRIADVPGTDFVISGINTKDIQSPVLGFGILKGVVKSNGSDLAVEYSLDGKKWNRLKFDPLSVEEGSALVWTYRVTSELPQAKELAIRFRQTGGGCVFRIDDVGISSKKD
ncbi:hypothetical protein [Bacteroides faecium]|uniref:DUF4251 domain-containing protein n=1 Tax=Bacteroides faecium TaxID=2715212 RepID=A0A6H0KHL7_9BACE|nr:hypothetical protein [Bacteroides faecium]QIU92673.1 hypothetical protein BacF7301_00195 [Bacteroides faecium]